MVDLRGGRDDLRTPPGRLPGRLLETLMEPAAARLIKRHGPPGLRLPGEGPARVEGLDRSDLLD
jgi:hypothetical protein